MNHVQLLCKEWQKVLVRCNTRDKWKLDTLHVRLKIGLYKLRKSVDDICDWKASVSQFRVLSARIYIS